MNDLSQRNPFYGFLLHTNSSSMHVSNRAQTAGEQEKVRIKFRQCYRADTVPMCVHLVNLCVLSVDT